MSTQLISGAQIIDPAGGEWHERTADVLLEAGRIVQIAAAGELNPPDATLIDGRGAFLSPGWVDAQTSLPDPGHEHREDLASLTSTAQAGGFTRLICQADSEPPLDQADRLRAVAGRAQSLPAKLHFMGCATLERAGERMAPLAELQAAGAVAFSDSPALGMPPALLSRLLLYVQPFDGLLVLSPLEPSLVAGTLANESPATTALGLRGSPNLAEELAISTALKVLAYTGGRLHLSPISTREGVNLLRQAKADGLAVTAGTAPHYLALTDDRLASFDARDKFLPPLRTEADRQALIAGIAEGSIDCVGSFHTPFAPEEKDLEFERAAAGAIGLQTVFPVLHRALVKEGPLSLTELCHLLASHPRRCFGLPAARIQVGEPAELTLFDPSAPWQLDRQTNRSRAVNSPWWQQELEGHARQTLV